MDNLARRDESAEEFGSFLHMISAVSDVAALDQMCHEYLYRQPPQKGLDLAAGMAWANPFFLPNIPRDSMSLLALDRGTFAELLMRAKLTAAGAGGVRLLVASAPFAAPGFFTDALTSALGLAPADFCAGATDPQALGAAGMDQEPDEFALVREGLLPGVGTIASHAMRATPYATRLLSRYDVRPIVVLRDPGDTIVDMDEALVAGTAPSSLAAMLPPAFATLERETRLLLLAGRFGAWIADFECTWIRATQEGVLQPLFLSYEEDFLGDRYLLARKVADHISPRTSAMKLAAVFEDRELTPAGKGADLPASVREMLTRVAQAYHGPTA